MASIKALFSTHPVFHGRFLTLRLNTIQKFNTPLLLAIEGGMYAAASALISAGADVNATDKVISIERQY
jgi:Ankyrin repeat